MALRSLSDVTLSTPGSEVLVEKDFVQGDIPYETVVPGNFTASGTHRTVSDAVVGTAVSSEASLQPTVVENKESSFQLYERAFQHYLGTSTEEAKVGTPFTPSAPTTTWEDIWAHVLKAEGGYANNPLDPGGETNYGISRAAYPNLNIRSLTPDDAKSIFKVDYFDKVNGDLLLLVNPGVAAHVADMAFNAGPQTAINLLYDSVGLPRQDRITNELVDRISSSEEAIANYSKARLSYYASLYTAPTFMKGWVNRVSNLNKALGTKSGLGGAYAAARDLDVEYLVQNQYGSYRNAQPRFRDLDESERGYLREREQLLSPGYQAAKSAIPADINDTKSSTIREVLGSTYDATYFTNTRAGLTELVNREAMKASELNRQALGELFEKSTLEKYTAGLYGGVLSVSDFEKELARFKQDYPDIKLPVSDVKQVYDAAGSRARLIEDRYANLTSEPFFDSLGSAASKVGQVAFGYLPGMIAGSSSDPAEMALMLGTGGTASTIKEALKYGAYAFLGASALQPFVQSKRKEIGLEGGFQQGLENAAAFGVGTATFGALAVGLKNLWKLGSKEAGKAANQIADNIDKILGKSATTSDSLYLKQELSDLKELGNIYKANPFGHEYSAKLQFEKRLGEASSDIVSGKPVRNINDDIRKFVSTDKKFIQDMSTAFKNSGPDGELLAKKFQENAKYWDAFKKSQLSHRVYSNIDDVERSMVPVVSPKTSDIYRFETPEEALKFLKSKEAESLISEHSVDIFPDPKGKGVFLGRYADLEPGATPSGRMVGDDVVEDVVNSVKVLGLKESDDILIAKKYPNIPVLKNMWRIMFQTNLFRILNRRILSTLKHMISNYRTN